MRKIILGAFIMLLVFGLMGCNDKPTSNSKEATVKFTNENWAELHTNPDKFKGSDVDVLGKVFLAPEKDADGTYFQMYADPKRLEYNTIVAGDPNLQVSDGDFVQVTGKAKGTFKGQNAFGAEITATSIIADKVVLVDAKDVLAPATLSVDVGQEKELHGLTITLNNIEFADEETRVYLTVKNGSQSKASLYSFNSKAIQGSTQYEEQTNFDVDYPEVSSEILPGIESSGVVVFKPLDTKSKSAKFIFEARTDNYSLDFEPYAFEITWD